MKTVNRWNRHVKRAKRGPAFKPGEMFEDIDKGFRYFWAKRGGVPMANLRD